MAYGTALVLGIGASGEAAARLLLGEGSRVTMVDERCDSDLIRRAGAIEKDGARVVLGAAVLPDCPAARSNGRLKKRDFDVCVVSPGVPADSKWIKAAEARGIKILPELELGASRCKCPLLAVTGSNGKSTLVKLCGDAMSLAGRRVALGGNYGTPLSSIAADSDRLDWVVVEVSSFQLEITEMFRPAIAVLLNIEPNHLDRHGDMNTYFRIKAKLFSGLGAESGAHPPASVSAGFSGSGMAGNTAIVPIENYDELSRMFPEGKRWITFGASRKADYNCHEGVVGFRDRRGNGCGNDWRTLSFAGTRFGNVVLLPAAAAASAAVEACGLDPVCVQEAARVFKPLPHRMEKIAEVNGISFVDDSKATSMAALRAALEMAGGSVRLVAGGLLKEKDLASPKKLLAKKVKCVYLIGSDSRQVENAWGDVVRCSRCENLERAVGEAYEDAEAGDTILLSPACASFDQFQNFEDRGKQFAALVNALYKTP